MPAIQFDVSPTPEEHPQHYLSVRFRDGAEQTILGPADIWRDPRIHERIYVRECLDLATKEAVVIYGGNHDVQEHAATNRQMYHDVRDVRTADDAVLTIRLMIFFELVNIETMLDTTHDPIGDFINAATSDVIEFTGKRSLDEFKQQTRADQVIEVRGDAITKPELHLDNGKRSKLQPR
jgi:hypothetical protein